jgi:S1-C subfamily serine protease
MQQIELVPKLRTITELKNKSALFITRVSKGSPAERAGLLDGDILYAFGDRQVETSDQLFKLLTEDKIGLFQFVNVLRDNKKMELKVTPGER